MGFVPSNIERSFFVVCVLLTFDLIMSLPFAGLDFLSGCSELLSLKLGLCTNITDKGLFYLTSNCKKIHELDLYR